MIVSFSVENWMSFQASSTISMVATNERQHIQRVPKLPKYQARILPIAVLYGANASGKTNLFKALRFAKSFIVDGTKPDAAIDVKPFILDDKSANQPTRFTFDLIINETLFNFSFSVSSEKVEEERLVEIRGTSEKELYHRIGEDIKLHESLNGNDFLNFAFKATRPNQLFLTNTVYLNDKNFKAVYDWFKDSLEIIAPDSRSESLNRFIDEDHPLYATMNDMLSGLDIGINRLGTEELPLDCLPITDELKRKLDSDVTEGTTVRLDAHTSYESFVVSRRNGKLQAKRLFTYHQKSDGSDLRLDFSQESEGAKRLIDLLPALLDLSAPSSKKVYVIDGFDRGMHTLLTRRLLKEHLDHCTADSRSQLLFTAHDVQLFDQELFRRDEMWVAERDLYGASRIAALGDFKEAKKDKDVRKSYLHGRIGGIPRILI